jgi:hypothetical protein
LTTEPSRKGAGNQRIYELIADSPKEGTSPTIWAWPQITEYLKVASQPVQGPWPPHQEPRPDPDGDSEPVAIPDSQGSESQASEPQVNLTPQHDAPQE